MLRADDIDEPFYSYDASCLGADSNEMAKVVLESEGDTPTVFAMSFGSTLPRRLNPVNRIWGKRSEARHHDNLIARDSRDSRSTHHF